MIGAADKRWNSATTLYIARKLESLAAGRAAPLRVMDMGCGTGRIVKFLHDYGHDLYGYDLAHSAPGAEANLAELYGADFGERFRFIDDERSIPFDDDSFDVIYANQVFEHVRFIDRMVAECARVLKPGGQLVTLFPFATYPLEGHVKIPFAHWLPPGPVRINYMTPFYMLGLNPRKGERSARQQAIDSDAYLRTSTFYRLMNEVTSLADHYFTGWTLDTGAYIQARLDMWAVRDDLRARVQHRVLNLLQGPVLDYIVTHYWVAVLVFSNPRQPSP